MAITYTWTITNFDVYPAVGEYTDVVFNIYWTRNAVDGATTASSFGMQAISSDVVDGYIPFDNITEEIAIGWLEAAFPEDQLAQIDANLATNINFQNSPSFDTLPPPWEK